MGFGDRNKNAFGLSKHENSTDKVHIEETAPDKTVLSPGDVLFVCNSNTVVSPIAEAIFNQFSGDRQAFSAGLMAQSGGRASQDAIKVCREHGIELSYHVTANINDFSLDDAGLMLTSTAHIRDALKMKFPDAEIFTIREYAGGYSDLDISDPLGEGLAGFEACFMQINEAVIKIIRKDMGAQAEEIVERPAVIVDEGIPESDVLSDGRLIVVSGLDGNLDYYNYYLSLWDKIDPNCHIVFLGNLIYSTEDDDGSLEILEDAIEKSQNYFNFHYLLGINELSCIMGENIYRMGINLKTKFENLIISKKSSLEPYLSEYMDFFKKLPYFVKTENGLFLSYSGPSGNVESLEETGSDLNLLHDFLWARKGEYESEDVEEFLDALGLKFMVVGNMSCDDGHEVFSRQLIISSGDYGENKSYLDIDLGEDIDSMDDLVGCLKSVDGIVKVKEDSVPVGNEDVESQNGDENIVNGEIIDKPTLNEKIRNFKYLDDLIHSGAKEIVLDSDIILEAYEESKYLEGIKLDVDDLVIDGNGHVIDACGKARIFKCTAEDVTIKNITLKNGFTQENGGAIDNFKGKLELINSVLSDNVSKKNVRSWGYGGAINNWEGDLSIKDSTLSNNVAEDDGGAINNLRGDLEIIRSILSDNSSKKGGGAIDNGAGNLAISDSTLSNNSAEDGGAIYNNGNFVLLNSELLGNVSNTKYGGGGAIRHYSGEAYVSNSLLMNNCAYDEGGAIHVGEVLHIVDSKICKNKAKYGGAIYANSGSHAYGVKVDVESSVFSENVAEEDGGAICEKYNVSNNFLINDSRLCMNRANRGGAIFTGDKMNLNFSILTSNSAIMGGALFNEGETEVIESELSQNTAEKCGGAIFSEGKLDIIFSRLLTNSADDAGAVYNNGLLSTSNSILSENSVRNSGCEVFNNKFSKFTNIKFEDNDGADNVYNAGRLIIIGKSFSRQFKTITAVGSVNISQIMNRTDEEEGIFEFKQLNDDQKDFSYLQELLNSGKSEIKLEHDIILDILNDEENVYDEGIKIWEDDLTIDGNGHLIDAQCAVPIFNCRAKNVKIKNITLKNGYVYSKSGVLYNDGILSINDCEILNNISKDGSIIYNDSELSVKDSDFQSNHSENGDILCNLKVCKIFNCEISSNRTSNIISNTDSLQIFNSAFTNNKSKNIIFNDELESNLSANSKFMENVVEESVVCNFGKSCILDRCIFEDNLGVYDSKNIINQSELTLIKPMIKEKGKTILNDGYVLLKDSNSGLKNMIHGEGTVESEEELIPLEQLYDFSYLDKIIHDSTTKEIVLDDDICLEKYERDFYEGGIDLDVDDLVIDGNGKTIDGAGKSRIFVVSGKNITLKNIIFKNGISHQNYDNPLNGHGGALRINSNSNLEIINCEFIGNVSEDCAGAIYNVDGACLDVVDCSFNQNKSNSHGGSILNDGELKCCESIFKEGSSDGMGGAIVSDGRLAVSKSQFLNNSSNRGGALTLVGEFDLENSKFISNKSENGGGAIYIQSNSKGSIENSTFQHNNASSGGAISNCGKLNLSNVEFIINIAKDNGGAINTISSSLLHVKESVFTGNKSISGGVGGGINTDRGADFKIVDSCFNGNGAYRGGAIYDSTEDSVVSGCKYMTEYDQVKFVFDD